MVGAGWIAGLCNYGMMSWFGKIVDILEGWRLLIYFILIYLFFLIIPTCGMRLNRRAGLAITKISYGSTVSG